MSPWSPLPVPHLRRERMLVIRIAIALGLALLLVIGAWSTSHGEADVNSTLCVAAGHSASDAATGAAAQEQAVLTDAPAATGALCLVAALCCALLVLLVRRLLAEGRRTLTGIAPRARLPRRAGPSWTPAALSLVQLSISRT